jgi:hypothetical protein
MPTGRCFSLFLVATFAALQIGTVGATCAQGEDCPARSEAKDTVLLQLKGALKTKDLERHGTQAMSAEPPIFHEVGVGYCDWHYKSGGNIGVEECAHRCADEPNCAVFTYGDALGCRYSACGSDPGPGACPDDKQCPIATSHSPNIMFALGADYHPIHEEAGDHAVCDESTRVAADCGGCGPKWGDLDACKDMCDHTEHCRFITFFSDDGCRMYEHCDSTWSQDYGGGSVLTSIFDRGH